MDNWVWKEKPFSKGQAWIDLILLAEYQDEDFVDSYGHIVHCKKGCVYMSERGLAERWNWSRHKVDQFLDQLEAQNMVKKDMRRASKRTSVFIVNWAKFQDTGTSFGAKTATKTGTSFGTYLKKKKEENCSKNIEKENLSEIISDEDEIRWSSADKVRPDRKGE